jgi:aspartate/methionine/tyrosine aminotransferase
MTSWRIGYLVVPAGTPSPIGRLQQAAVAPGTAFGPAGEGWVRLPLATDTDALLEGAHRLAGFALT